MPASPEALLISAVLRTGDVSAPMAAGLNYRMFYAHREEWKYIEQYIDKNRKPPSKSLFKTKFPEFIVYKVDDVEGHTQEVIREHQAQLFVDVTSECMDLVEAGDIDAAMRRMHQVVIKTETHRVGQEFNMFDDWETTFDDVKKRVRRVERLGQAGVPSGFPSLDRITGGFQPGWSCIVGARLGQGKTWALTRMAWSAVVSGYGVSYFSLEQNRHQIAMRTHSFASGQYGKEVFQSLDLMRGHGFDLELYREFLTDVREQVAGTFYVVDLSRGRVSPTTIAAHVEKVQPDIVFVDYMTLLQQTTDGYEGTTKLSADVKMVAEEQNVPIVSAAQINRMGVGKEPPDPESLARSDSIGQDADIILTMKQASSHVMKMKLAKFRHGPDGITWFCEFKPGTGKFDEITGDRAAEIMERDREVD